MRADSPHSSTPLAHGVRETARLLGVSPRYVYTLINRGELRTLTLGKRRLVLHESLLDLLQRRQADT
jgi:excisionase family DNA binding protein